MTKSKAGLVARLFTSLRARPIHRPRLVMLHEEIESLLRCQGLVAVERDGHIADSWRVDGFPVLTASAPAAVRARRRRPLVTSAIHELGAVII